MTTFGTLLRQFRVAAALSQVRNYDGSWTEYGSLVGPPSRWGHGALPGPGSRLKCQPQGGKPSLGGAPGRASAVASVL